MILYFSATGNSKYVAKRIADALGDEISSISEIKDTEEKDVLGIIAPTYAWGIPSVVEDFLKTHKLTKKDNYIFYLATCGTTTGNSDTLANKLLNEYSGISFDAFYGVKMPDTWTPIFDLSDKEKVDEINRKAEGQIDEVIEQIKQRNTTKRGKFCMPKVMKITYKPYYNHMRQTKNFTVESSCIGCELCARKCPVKAIEIQDKKPVWVKDRCTMCLGCLHRCPKFAIQYGKNTKKHGQYMNPNEKV